MNTSSWTVRRNRNQRYCSEDYLLRRWGLWEKRSGRDIFGVLFDDNAEKGGEKRGTEHCDPLHIPSSAVQSRSLSLMEHGTAGLGKAIGSREPTTRLPWVTDYVDHADGDGREFREQGTVCPVLLRLLKEEAVADRLNTDSTRMVNLLIGGVNHMYYYQRYHRYDVLC